MKLLKCGSCTKCCIRDMSPLTPEEVNSGRFEHERGPRGIAILKRSAETGSCIYLGETGCTIHGRAPKACQAFDCRLRALQVAAFPPHEIAKRIAYPLVRDVILEGARRLERDAPKKHRRVAGLVNAIKAQATTGPIRLQK